MFQALAYAWREECGSPLAKLAYLWLMKEACDAGIAHIDFDRLEFFTSASRAEISAVIKEMHECPGGPILRLMDDMSACVLILPVRSGAWDDDGEFVPIKRRPLSSVCKEHVRFYCGDKCFGCGSKDALQYDHIIPISKGGEDHYANIQLLCAACNSKKSNRLGWFDFP